MNEKHETTKEIVQSTLLVVYFGIGALILSMVLFLFDFLNYGMVSLTLMIFFFFVGLLGASKIYSRHVQELLLKMHNKKWDDYCECYDCLLKRHPNEEK